MLHVNIAITEPDQRHPSPPLLEMKSGSPSAKFSKTQMDSKCHNNE